MIEKTLEKLANFENKRPFTIIGIFIVLTLILSSGFALIDIDDKLGAGLTSIIIIFRPDPEDPGAETDMRNLEILKATDLMLQHIEESEFVVSSIGLPDIVKTNGAFPSQTEINAIIADSLAAESLISDDYDIALARIALPDGMSLEQQQRAFNEVREIVTNSRKPLGLEVSFAGAIFGNIEANESLGGSISFVTTIGFIAVFIILFIIFRKPDIVLITVAPIVFATMWTFGTMGFIGIPLSTILSGIFSMIIGVGIDFAIHIVHRYEEERKKKSPEMAVLNAVKNVGRGLTFTTITTVIGFLALLSATLPALHDMAIALSLGVFYALVGALGIIPPLLVLSERLRARLRKRKARKARQKAREKPVKKREPKKKKGVRKRKGFW